MKKLLIILFLASSPLFAGGSHHGHRDHETTVNNYSLVNQAECTGLAALGAMNQIHPSENVSGLQLGGGVAMNGDCFGKAIGAHLNVKGWGVVGGSIAKENDETIWGAGFNFSLKP